MTSIRPTRFPKLAIASTAVLTSVLTAMGVNLYVENGISTEKIIIVNEQTVVSGTGAGANSSSVYDYGKYSGYLPLTQTGGEIKQEYQVYNYDYLESYTGAILSFCIDVATPATMVSAMTVDCGVVASSADTSSGTNLFDNESLTAGAHCIEPASTEVTIGPNQSITCYSNSGTGTSLEADGITEYRETELN